MRKGYVMQYITVLILCKNRKNIYKSQVAVEEDKKNNNRTIEQQFLDTKCKLKEGLITWIVSSIIWRNSNCCLVMFYVLINPVIIIQNTCGNYYVY